MQAATSEFVGTVFTATSTARPIFTPTVTTTLRSSGAPQAVIIVPCTRGAPSWALDRGAVWRWGAEEVSRLLVAFVVPLGAAVEDADQADTEETTAAQPRAKRSLALGAVPTATVPASRTTAINRNLPARPVCICAVAF
jgi:hypothetical protein